MNTATKLATIAATAMVAGGTAFLVREKLAGATVRGGCSPNNPLPHAGSGAADRQVPIVAEHLKRAWSEIVGGEMPPAALEIALSQAWLESGIGTWWKDKTGDGAGNMIGSNNLGARQCGGNDSGGADYTCVEYGDSSPNADGTQTYFPAKFRYYNSLEAGAKDFLYSIVKQWPATEELKNGDVLGYVIRQGPKYRSADPPNQKVFGREYKGGNGYYGGFGATMQERVGGYGRAIVSHLPAVAAALGHAKIYACIAPELLTAGSVHAAVSGACCGQPPPEDVAFVHELLDNPFADDSGYQIAEKELEMEGFVSSALVTAALAAGGLFANRQIAEKGAERLEQALSKQGVQIVPDGLSRSGYVDILPGNQRVLAALEDFSSTDSTGVLSKAEEYVLPKIGVQEVKKLYDAGLKLQVAMPPADAAAEELITSAPVQSAINAMQQSAVIQGVESEPVVLDGVGATVATAVVAAVAAGTAGTLVEHYLKKPKAKTPIQFPREMVQAAQRPRRAVDTKAATAPAASQPVATTLDEDRGSLAAFRLPTPATTLDEDRGSLSALAAPKPDFSLPPDPEKGDLTFERVPTKVNFQGEQDVTPETAAASDAYATGNLANVQGVAKTVAIAAGTLVAAGAATGGVLYEREHRLSGERVALLRDILRKHGWDVISTGKDIPPGYVAAAGSLMEPGFYEAMTEYQSSLGMLDRLMPSGDPYKVLGWMMRDGSQLVRKSDDKANGGKVEGVAGDIAVAAGVAAGGIAAGVAAMALLSRKAAPASPAPAPAAPSAPMAPPPKPKPVQPSAREVSDKSLQRLKDELARMLTPDERGATADPGALAAKLAEIKQAEGNVSVSGTGDAARLGATIQWQYYACIGGKGVQVGPLFPDFGVSVVDAAMLVAYRDKLDSAPCNDIVTGRMWRLQIDDGGVGGAVVIGGAAGSQIGETIQALHATGTLPRARAIPGSNGTAFVWYTEKPTVEGPAKRVSATSQSAPVRKEPHMAKGYSGHSHTSIETDNLGVFDKFESAKQAVFDHSYYAAKNAKKANAPLATVGDFEVYAKGSVKSAGVLNPPTVWSVSWGYSDGWRWSDGGDWVSIDGTAQEPSLSGVVSPTAAAVVAFASGAVVGASALKLAQGIDSKRKDVPTIVPEPPPPIAPPPAPQPRTYVVRPGDSPFKIAVAHNASGRGAWWKELSSANPQKETTGVPKGWKQLLPGETIVVPKEWPVNYGDHALQGAESGDMSMTSLLASVGAKDDEPDEADKALATGSDVADAFSSLLNVVQKGKNIVQRQATIEDPKCRKLVKAFVEKHPIIARYFANDLRSLAGTDAAHLGETPDTVTDRYLDRLLQIREAKSGGPLTNCVITPDEHRAALGAAIAPLGVSEIQEAAILGASDFEIFANSLNKWSPAELLPALAPIAREIAPVAASMMAPGAGAGGGAMSALLAQQRPQAQPERAAPPPPPPPPAAKGVSIPVAAAIAAGTLAAGAAVVAIAAKKH